MLKQNTWNVLSESIRREYGFSQHIEKRIHDSGLFYKNCLGSLFITERMQFSHLVREPFTNHLSVNFKNDGILVCTGTSDRYVHIYDWKSGSLKFSLKTNHKAEILHTKFLCTSGNSMDIITSCGYGQVRHTLVAPDGHSVSQRILRRKHNTHSLITVPENPLVFIAASTDSGIVQVDLRCESWSPPRDQSLRMEDGQVFNIEDIAHHPLRPELCVGGYSDSVYIIDKRNLKDVVKRLYPKKGDIEVVHACCYNYNGTEILANCEGQAFLLDNTINETDGYLHVYEKNADYLENFAAIFFGPKSEYILRGTDFLKICFLDKTTGNIAHSVQNGPVSEGDANRRLLLDIHPHLPVIASTSGEDGISIWAPTPLKSNTNQT